MCNVKSNFILAFLLLWTISAFTQPLNNETADHPEATKRACELSLFVGKAYTGPSKEISTSMGAYPNIAPPISLTFKCNVNQNSGISFSRGKNESAYIHGDGSGPIVRSILKSTSFDYVHSLGHNRHECSAGISFITLHIKSNNHDDSVTGKNEVRRTGFNIGYAFHLIERKEFFLSFHAQYHWAGAAAIGPYSIYEHAYSYDGVWPFWPFFGEVSGTVPSRTTDFEVAKVHLDAINIGFSIGFRFGNFLPEASPPRKS